MRGIGSRQKVGGEPKNRRATGAVAAVALAMFGVVGLVTFVKGAEERALAGEKLVDVLVVTKKVDAGTAVTDLRTQVRQEQVPAKTRADGAVADLVALGDRVASVDLLPGEQITTRRFVSPATYGRTKGRVAVPGNLLEVTVSLEPERAVGGVISPGSTVGVLASFEPFENQSDSPVQIDGMIVPPKGKTPNTTHLMLHKVLVSNVQAARASSYEFGGNSEEDESATAPAPTDNLLVTLALPAGAVERVVYAAEHGEIWLAYEPEGASTGGTRVQHRGTIYE